MHCKIELPSSMQPNNAGISSTAPELKTPAIGTIPLPIEAPPAFTAERHLGVPSPHFISSPVHHPFDMFSSPPIFQGSTNSFDTLMNEGHSAHRWSLGTNDKPVPRFTPPAAPAPLIHSPTPGPSVLPETLPQSLAKRSSRRGESSSAGPSRTTRKPRENAPRNSGVRPPKFRTEEEWDAVHRYPNGELKPATKAAGGKWKCVCSERPVTLRTIRERHQKFERRVCAEEGCGKDLGRPDALVRHRCTEHNMHNDCKTKNGKGGCRRKLGSKGGSERGESRGR
ncbi:hypothetical protein PENSPDRAFT_287218 [Peniophora sp. CONT]|nr:hypothetical protein PENSPDRAFT_287218 [Peniophora sp. CONT]